MIILIVFLALLFAWLAIEIWENWDRLLSWSKSEEIYYDPRCNELFQTKFKAITGVICGGHCNYYGDAHTNVERQRLSWFYLLRCRKVINCDQCSFLYHDGINWRVKRGNK